MFNLIMHIKALLQIKVISFTKSKYNQIIPSA